MKRALLVLLSIYQSFILFSQIQFEQAPPLPPEPQIIADFDAIQNSDVKFVDVNGDGFKDAMITGNNFDTDRVSKLYLNDGTGIFNEFNGGSSIEGVEKGAIDFADIDNDGDQDLIITGLNNSNIRIAKLYTNDGSGYYSEVLGTPFEGVEQGSVDMTDIDTDGDLDLLVSGLNSMNDAITKLYTNDGSGSFTLVSGTPFEDVKRSSILFSDFDGNGSQDVIITGINNSNARISKLYTNDGNGFFTELIGVPFEPVDLSSVSAADIDGDLDNDVLITGRNASGSGVTNLYTNDGGGNFTHFTSTSLETVHSGSSSFSDVDNDGDQDVFITGSNNSSSDISKLYMNDGTGSFTENSSTFFEGVNLSSIAFSDIDSDNDQDLLITGNTHFNYKSAKIYVNNGTGVFDLVKRTTFEAVRQGSVAFADIDGDLDKDLLLTGTKNFLTYQGPTTKLYRNLGGGNFEFVNGTPFEDVEFSSIAFEDVDGDGDQDVLITGWGSYYNAKLYLNDGNGNFTEDFGSSFTDVMRGTVNFSDIDNDGDKDVLITGWSGQYTAKLYLNDGNGSYTFENGTPFEGVDNSSVSFADLNNDGYEDVIVSGHNGGNTGITNLYINDGNGNFIENITAPFEDVMNSSTAVADVDGDSDLDVVISGLNNSNDRITKLYMNDGSGNFSENTGVSFQGVQMGSVAFSDADNDGDQDFLLTGAVGSVAGQTTKFYKNNGNGNFVEVTDLNLCQVFQSSVAFEDINNNGKDDLLITGWGIVGQSVPFSKLYLNTTCFSSVIDSILVCDASSYQWIDGNMYTSNNNTATHTLTNVAGCDSIIKLDLTLANSTSSTDVISTCDSLTWIDGNTYWNNNSSATYTLTNSTGCDSTVTLDLTINTATTGINQLDAITLQADASNAQYQWLDCGNNNSILTNETNQTYVATNNGNYAVVVTENGCIDTSACITVSSVGIIENGFGNRFSLYPNPTTGDFSIDLGATFENVKIIITDISGRTIDSRTTNKSQFLNLSIDEPSGIYLVSVEADNKIAIIRLVKR